MIDEPIQPIERSPEEGQPPSIDIQTIIGIALVGALVLVGLNLPPISLGQRVFGFGYKAITANNPAVTEGSLTVSLAEPDGSLRVKISSVPKGDFSGGKAGARWSEAADALPSSLELVSPVYELDGRGKPSSEVVLEMSVPDGGYRFETLDLYTWDTEQDEWVFVPNAESPADNALRARLDALPGSVALFNTKRIAPMLSVVQEPDQTVEAEPAASFNVLMPAGLQPSAAGSLVGSPAGGVQGNFAIVPLVRNYGDLRTIDTASVSAILSDVNVQQAHLDALVGLVVDGGNDGVALDYRGLTADQEPAFTALVTALAEALHDEGKMLVVVVPPPTPKPDGTGWETTGYNWRSLGAAVDMLEVWPSASPGDYTAEGTGGQVLAWASGEVSRYKLHMGTSTLSMDVSSGLGVPVTYEEALSHLSMTVDPPLPDEGEGYEPGTALTFNLGGEGVSNVSVDPASGLYRYDYTDGDTHTIWIVTADKVRERLALVPTYNLAGVVVHDLLADGNADGVQQAVVDYKIGAAIIAQEGVQVQWVVKDPADQVLLDQRVAFGESGGFQTDTDNQLAAYAWLRDPEKREIDSISFTVGAGAPEEEEEEEEEPAPAPVATTETETSEPVAAAPPPAASTAGGGFELGGQTHTLDNAGLMHDMGMTWVKFQEKWSPGASGYDVSGFVELGHANNFKVLISIPGPPYPTSIDYDAYVQFVREAADAGADGIEIWNEMNLDREWPAGQISGASYVNNMLAPAYNAIKSVNPSTLVISGALAPTGYFGGCTSNGCDDWAYTKEMAAAGAASYMDCVGLHYNAGATSPLASGGHPADSGDGHYTWYFQGMVNAYSVVGKPLCFTELGYLSDDGYASVSGTGFSWASNTTVDQQAQWLSEAVSSARSFARLLIVWNVDIFTYDPTDPQGGYALIRPDGSCPACNSIAAVMP